MHRKSFYKLILICSDKCCAHFETPGTSLMIKLRLGQLHSDSANPKGGARHNQKVNEDESSRMELIAS